MSAGEDEIPAEQSPFGGEGRDRFRQRLKSTVRLRSKLSDAKAVMDARLLDFVEDLEEFVEQSKCHPSGLFAVNLVTAAERLMDLANTLARKRYSEMTLTRCKTVIGEVQVLQAKFEGDRFMRNFGNTFLAIVSQFVRLSVALEIVQSAKEDGSHDTPSPKKSMSMNVAVGGELDIETDRVIPIQKITENDAMKIYAPLEVPTELLVCKMKMPDVGVAGDMSSDGNESDSPRARPPPMLTGTDIVDWLVGEFGISQNAAMNVGTQLLQQGVLAVMYDIASSVESSELSEKASSTARSDTALSDKARLTVSLETFSKDVNYLLVDLPYVHGGVVQIRHHREVDEYMAYLGCAAFAPFPTVVAVDVRDTHRFDVPPEHRKRGTDESRRRRSRRSRIRRSARATSTSSRGSFGGGLSAQGEGSAVGEGSFVGSGAGSSSMDQRKDEQDASIIGRIAGWMFAGGKKEEKPPLSLEIPLTSPRSSRSRSPSPLARSPASCSLPPRSPPKGKEAPAPRKGSTTRTRTTTETTGDDWDLCSEDASAGGSKSSTLLCRICEDSVPVEELEKHSTLCALRQKVELKQFSVEVKLRKLAAMVEETVDPSNPLYICKEHAMQAARATTVDEIAAVLENTRQTLAECKLDHSNFSVDHLTVEQCDHNTTGAKLRDSVEEKLYALKEAEMVKRVAFPMAGDLFKFGVMKMTENKRWFEHNATENALYYFKGRPEDGCPDWKAATGNIPLTGASIVIPTADDTKSFHIIPKDKRVHVLRAPTSLLRSAWVSALRSYQSLTGTGPERKTEMNLKTMPTISDFAILQPLSGGAYGRVYLARKISTGDVFAIKILRKSDIEHKNLVDSVFAERNIMALAENPYVVKLFYSFESEHHLFLVMEYLPGGDMSSLLQAFGYFEADVARRYVVEVVLALEYLHKRGIVHRDLKPSNIVIAADGHLKLTDFGLSHLGIMSLCAVHQQTAGLQGAVNVDLPTQSKPLSGGVVGTPDYIAPETLVGAGHGKEADWWALGIIVSELLVGLPPFYAESPTAVFDNVLNLNGNYGDPPLDGLARDLVDKLLAKTPSERLGAGGADEVKQHPWFEGIDWDNALASEAWFVPRLTCPEDVSYSRPDGSYADRKLSFLAVGDPQTSRGDFQSFAYKNLGELERRNQAELDKHTGE